MRRKIMLSAAVAAAIAAFAFAPGPAQAHGDIVSVKDSYMPGTIVIRTGERRLYYFVGAGEAIRYPVGVGRRIASKRLHWAHLRGPPYVCFGSTGDIPARSGRCLLYP
jgi:hypothetical protein